MECERLINMERPLVSVVISAYNHENYILPCLESFISQTYENIELFLFNDGSTDHTNEKVLSIIEKLRSRFTRFEYINKQNEGISKNFNLGITRSKGKYIKTFASDDIIMPDAIEKLVTFLEENPSYDIVYGDGYHIYTKKEVVRSEDLKEKSKFSNLTTYISGNIYDHLYSILPYMSTWTVLFRQKCFVESGLYDENLLCEDMDLYLRFSKKYKFGYITEIIALHRIHGENAGLTPEVMLPTFYKMLDKYDSTGFFENTEYRNRFLKLIAWCERVITPIDYSKHKVENKKVIGWGTGGYYQKYKDKIPLNFEYFIDSDSSKHGMLLDGVPIYPVENILHEDKNNIFVSVLKRLIDEIFNWLNKSGFESKKNYYE